AVAVPVVALDHVVAVAQGRDVLARGVAHAHLVAGVAADEAVGGGDGAGDAGRAAAPRRRATAAVPVVAADDVVAVAQGCDAAVIIPVPAHLVAGVAADEAVGGGDGAGDAGRAAAPRRRPTAAVPRGADDHVVAVAQRRDVDD